MQLAEVERRPQRDEAGLHLHRRDVAGIGDRIGVEPLRLDHAAQLAAALEVDRSGERDSAAKSSACCAA